MADVSITGVTVQVRKTLGAPAAIAATINLSFNGVESQRQFPIAADDVDVALSGDETAALEAALGVVLQRITDTTRNAVTRFLEGLQ